MERSELKSSQRWVIKIGSALLTDDGRGLNHQLISCWVEQMCALRQQGVEIVLVSSGAVAEGMTRLGWQQRPEAVHELQAAAAIGQVGLVQAYEAEFKQADIQTAQILLNHDDLANRKRYLNARSTLRTLLGLGVLPIVNENDTVVTEEIRFGDNDTLAALVANLLEADALIILTDQNGLYESDPRKNSQAQMIECADANDKKLEAMAGEGGELGRGGMITKVRAAQKAARSGCHCLIANGRGENILLNLFNGDNVGTFLTAEQKPLAARKQWLAGQLQLQGRLVLDDGAVKVLQQSGRSLLAVGVTAVEGDFIRGALVSCVDSTGKEIARGLVNYNAEETLKIKGLASGEILDVLGYQGDAELIHRDNLVAL